MRKLARTLLGGVMGLGLLAAPVLAQEKPKYGGTLEVGTVYVTLTALSFDPADWNWKLNHDTGNYLEQLFAADLSKSVRNGGKHPFYADAWLPTDAIRGELAESWEWKQNPLRVEVKLRKGVMFPEKPGVMAARELTADDVVFSWKRVQSPGSITKLDLGGIQDMRKVDAFTVDVETKAPFPLLLNNLMSFTIMSKAWCEANNAKEASDLQQKKENFANRNANGTGPFMLKSREVEDPVNLWVHRPLAYLFVAAIYRTSITPNQITFLALTVGTVAKALGASTTVI